MQVSLRARFTLAIVALAGVLLALSLVAVGSLRRLGGAVGTILQENYASVIACGDMNEALERLDSAALFATTGQRQIARPMLDRHRADFEQALAREAGNLTLPGEGARVAAVSASYRDYVAAVDRVLASSNDRDSDGYFRELLPRFYRLKGDIQTISRMNQAQMEWADRNAQLTARSSIQLTLAASVLALLLAGSLAIWLPRVIVEPISALRGAAQRIGEGNLDMHVATLDVAELVPLAEAFNVMLSRLRAYRESSLGELLAARDLAHTTIACLLDPVMVFRRGGDILLVNDAATRAFGLREGTAEELRAADVTVPEKIREDVEQVLASGEPVLPSSFSEAMHHPGGEGERHFLVRAAPLAEGAESRSALVVAQDVTRFRRIDELKSSVVATVSHELKTPLTSLRMATHMLLEPERGPLTEAQRELCTIARDDTERLRLLVDEFLDLTRIEAEAGALRRVPSSPGWLLGSVASAHRSMAEGKGVSLEVTTDACQGSVELDPDKMSIALANLVANAIEHTQPGGLVSLGASLDAGRLRLVVSDAGEGIRPEDVPHIFERFRRGSEVGRDVRHLGLGLAITREIVQQHGGDVAVESARGGGTKFTITIPVP
jgi:two-component system, NtrC family, sensor histidine kinase KinB